MNENGGMPGALLTEAAFATLASAATLVWLIVNGIRVFLGFYRKWLFVLISFLAVAAMQAITSADFTVGRILLILGNTFLLAFTASGAQETLAHAATPVGSAPYSAKKYKWFDSWFT
jgi:hypothetical protein